MQRIVRASESEKGVKGIGEGVQVNPCEHACLHREVSEAGKRIVRPKRIVSH